MPQLKTRAECKQEALDGLRKAKEACVKAITNIEERGSARKNRTHCDDCECDVQECRCLCCCGKRPAAS